MSHTTIAFSAALAFVAAGAAATAHAADAHSFAEPEAVRVTALDLDLRADFDARILRGHVDLALDWRDPDARALVLDSRELDIKAVQSRDGDGNWQDLDFTLAQPDAILGSKLSIAVPASQPQTVRVRYATAPGASGLQWLTPAQTLGDQPFMFSQSQAIHARSWVPLQDTPAVRFTYTATVQVPPALLALMSAENPQALRRDGRYRFSMQQPIPSYLMAIAIGRLQFKAIDERSGVYAEPERLDEAVAEFADTGRMIDAAEALYGPYRWGRYDLLILPPSFPYGGMENPRLSFITPTVIAGDRSLVALIAHELAHSWSGNLVTNSNWDEFWLNEGFTSYVENRIVEALYGQARADMEFVLDTRNLRRDFRELPVTTDLQRLTPKLAGLDPDAVYTTTAYTKGSWFLKFLERQVGRAQLDAWLRGWFDRHAFASIDTATFRADLQRELLDAQPDKVSAAQLDAWLHAPDIPAFAPAFESAAFDRIDAQRARFLAGELEAAELPGGDWSTQEWLYFLNGLPAQVEGERLAALDAAHDLTGRRNSEVAFAWFMIGINNGYAPIRPALEKFLVEIGRRKFVVPLYRALAAREDARDFALAVFERARAGYHPITLASVEEVLRAP
jgi:leukotriene-A4 hydrolase